MTPHIVARQAPWSMGFPRQAYWSGLPCPSPGDLPDPGSNTSLLHWQVGSLLLSHQGSLSLWEQLFFSPKFCTLLFSPNVSVKDNFINLSGWQMDSRSSNKLKYQLTDSCLFKALVNDRLVKKEKKNHNQNRGSQIKYSWYWKFFLLPMYQLSAA